MPEKRERQDQETGDELQLYGPVTDDMVLVAVERADGRDGLIWDWIVEHLGFVRSIPEAGEPYHSPSPDCSGTR
ncbi:MAG TPA: hypothetical protein VMB51_16200 [Solirubrobacteraceae bacterium]|nr:hypothetical protein [Solirubrobacteraceae bacterium]